jgi:phosphoribosylformylglycinamidine synthase
MSQATTAVLYVPGTNCHEETAAAIEFAGGKAEVVLLRDLLDGRKRLDEFQAAVIPGGFSYGDHLGAGRIFGTTLVAQLRDQLVDFLDAQKPLLGVCNGFQVLAEAGILPGRTPGMRAMALIENHLGMPSAHGEGRPLLCQTDRSPQARVVFRFTDGEGRPTMGYPDNPNGAEEGVAGITDETGLVLGLMPHPERASLPAQYSQDGLSLFKNLVRWLAR